MRGQLRRLTPRSGALPTRRAPRRRPPPRLRGLRRQHHPLRFWPRGPETATRVDNTTAALAVQNEWDAQTPAAGARALHHALRGSRLAYVRGGRGHVVHSLPGAPECVTRTVDAYLTEGRLPVGDVTCRT
ncbi:alpha/beta hydrolase [Streptomyces sp. R35]|uniref:Alpha/beta hydrolase n=1 Tax=Streptomyces sp. R35 TaxID=3238630 RepID=A0AB39SI10_9ACTN